MATAGDVFVVSASGSGHITPCIELCKHFSSRNFTTTLVLSSTDASSVSPSRLGPISAVVEVTSPERGNPPVEGEYGMELEAHLATRFTSDLPESSSILCAVIDFPMGWTKPIFWKFKIPVITLFTFSACAAAMEWGAWKSRCGDLNPGDVGLINGLPHEMNITYLDCARARRPPKTSGGGGPPRPGDRPPWIPLTEGSTCLMFNTCDDLERPFMDYLTREMGLPIWGVGPLFPNQFCQLPNNSMAQASDSEDQLKLKQWLDTKHENSVVFIAFGSQVSLTIEETLQLACALEETSHPFIWVVKNSDIQESERLNFENFFQKVSGKGLVVRGWAPQLFILNHPSTGGFLSHCGWNSTLEAIGHGVPILAWPIRGDQIYNAKLVVNHLKVGFMALPGESLEISKNDILGGIEKLMADDEVRARADSLRSKLRLGFPSSSNFTVDDLGKFLRRNQKSNAYNRI